MNSDGMKFDGLKFERIVDAGHPYYEDAIELYKISFPAHEQRKKESQIEILSDPRYHFDAVFDDGVFVGEILCWNIGEFLYVEHFCVMPNMRNRHYGQRILAALQDKPMILEIDPPVDEISIRRKGFYERCGFVANPYAHIHPPYSEKNEGHSLVVMSSPKELTLEEYEVFNRGLCDMVMAGAV